MITIPLYSASSDKLFQINDYHILLNILQHTAEKIKSAATAISSNNSKVGNTNQRTLTNTHKTQYTQQLIQQPPRQSSVIKNPIDEKINALFSELRNYVCIQNNALLVCFDKMCLLLCVTENNEACYKINIRLNDIWFADTILEGQWALDQAVYGSVRWSPVSQYFHDVFPKGEQIELIKDVIEENSEDIDENDEICENEIAEDIESPQKKLRIDLAHRVGSVFAEVPDQQERLFKCCFYIRNVWLLSGKTFTKDSPQQYAELLSNLNIHLSEKNYICDDNLDNLKLINRLSGVYTHQYVKDTVSLKLALYQSIPYTILDKKIISHLNAIPTLNKLYDFQNTMHAFISYYGSEKPGIYLLSAINNPLSKTSLSPATKFKENIFLPKTVTNECGLKLQTFDVAFIPTLEVQQYIVHLIKTRGTKKPVIVQCVYSPIKKKWTPVAFAANRREPDDIKDIINKYN